MEQAEQKFYDAGFDDAKRSAAVVIKEANLKGFIEGWMVVFNAISLPLTSPFRDSSQVPLLVKKAYDEGHSEAG